MYIADTIAILIVRYQSTLYCMDIIINHDPKRYPRDGTD